MHIQGIQLWQQLLQQQAANLPTERLLSLLAAHPPEVESLQLDKDWLNLNLLSDTARMRLGIDLSNLKLASTSALKQGSIAQFANILKLFDQVSFATHSSRPQLIFTDSAGQQTLRIDASSLQSTSDSLLLMRPVTAIYIGNKLLPISTTATVGPEAGTPTKLSELLAAQMLNTVLPAAMNSTHQSESPQLTLKQQQKFNQTNEILKAGGLVKSIETLSRSSTLFKEIAALMEQLPAAKLSAPLPRLDASQGTDANGPGGARLRIDIERLSELIDGLREVSRQSHSLVQKLSPQIAGSAHLLASAPKDSPANKSELLLDKPSVTEPALKTIVQQINKLVVSQQRLVNLLQRENRPPGNAPPDAPPDAQPGQPLSGRSSSIPSTIWLQQLATIQNQIYRLSEVLLSALPGNWLTAIASNENADLVGILGRVISLLEAHIKSETRPTTSPDTPDQPAIARQSSNRSWSTAQNEPNQRLPELMLQMGKLLQQQSHAVNDISRHFEAQQLQMLRQGDQFVPQLICLPLTHQNQINQFEILFESPSKRPGGKTQRIYRVTIQFDLPPLGPMYAKLELINDRINTRIYAKESGTVSLLSEFMPVLEQSLAEAGLNASVTPPEKACPPETLAETLQQAVNIRV